MLKPEILIFDIIKELLRIRAEKGTKEFAENLRKRFESLNIDVSNEELDELIAKIESIINHEIMSLTI